MADINSVVLVGRLTRDSELKYTQGGTAVSKLSIAINSKKKVGDNWTEEANYFDIVLWGKVAEALNQYLKKGKEIAVEGELRQNRWEQEGKQRSRVEILAKTVKLCGSGKPNNQQEESKQEQSKQDKFEDDIPF